MAFLGAAVLALCAGLAQAQVLATRIVADPSAPGTQRATVLGASNGVPQVDIQTPSAAGVSRNRYSQFDVGGQGVILNNSRTNVQTQLAGWVQGNPWLARGSARVILNEVQSASPSQLRGYVEVAGPRAEVVVANPSGIAVNGAGFLNASAVTLTTGAALVDSSGLVGYRVQGGTVRVEGAGLDTQGAEYTAILGRAVEVHGGLWAQRLQAVTGANEITRASLGSDAPVQATPVATAGPAPAFAFDASALGGMYARQITLIGTEAGLGVRNAGAMLASAGSLVLSHEGWLSNSGRLQAPGGDIVMQARGALSQGGVVAADGDVLLRSGGDQTHEGAVTAYGNLQVQGGGHVQFASEALAGGTLALEGRSVDVSRSRQDASVIDLRATEGALQAAGARLVATGRLQLQTPQALVTDGAQLQAPVLRLQAHDLSNVGGQIVQTGSDDQAITLAGRLDNMGGTLYGAGDLALVVAGVLDTRGTIAAGRDLHVRAGEFRGASNHLLAAGLGIDGKLSGAGALAVTTVGALQSAGRMLAAGDASLAGSRLDLSGSLVASAGGDVRLTATEGEVRTRNARVVSPGLLAIAASGNGQWLDNASGTLGGGYLDVVAGHIDNTGGTLAQTRSAAQAASIRSAGGLSNQGGTLASAGDLRLSLQGDHTLDGNLLAGGDLLLETTGRLTNPLQVQAGGSLQVSAQDLDNLASGELLSGQTTHLRVTGTFTNRGLVDGVDTRIEAGTVDNVGSGRIYGDRVAIAATHLLNRQDSQAATLAGRLQVDLGLQTLDNRPGALIYSGGDLAIGGALDANWRATGRAVSLQNTAATIEATRNLRVTAADIGNHNGGIATALRFQGQGPLTQYQHMPGDTTSASDNSTRFAPADARVWDCEALCLSTSAGTSDAFVRYDFNRSVSATVVTDSAPGKILSGGNMQLSAVNLLNRDSHIVAGGALEVVGTQADNLQTTGVRIASDSGTATAYSRKRRRGRDSFWTDVSAYEPGPLTETIALGLTRYEDHAAAAPLAVSTPGLPQPAQGVALSSAVANARTAATAAAAPAGGNPAPTPPSQTSPTALATPQVRTLPLSPRLPSASLFRIHPESGVPFLVETDPRFTQQRAWLSSDYMLTALQRTPGALPRRMGDGFYEQQMVRDQVLALTGQRYLGHYTSDEQAYQALMDAGVTYARQWNLIPGVALSAEQVAQLTSDIVWLVTKDVTLPDGSTQRVLVPQVYVLPREGDVEGSGALLAGREVNIQLSGDLKNGGTVAGRTLLQITADNIRNLGGLMNADSLALQATQDIENVGGRLQAQSAAALVAGRDIRFTTTTSSASSGAGASRFTQTGVDRVAGLYVTGPAGALLASAGHDIQLTAAHIRNADAAGTTVLQAGNDIHLGTVNTGSSQAIAWNSDNHLSQSSSTEVGTQIVTGGAVSLRAGRDVNARAAQVEAGDALAVTAGRNVTVTAGQDTQSLDVASQHTSHGLMSSRTLTLRESSEATTAQGSSLEGRTVAIDAGQDLALRGSAVLADSHVNLQARGDVVIEAAQDTYTRSSSRQEVSSGLMSGGGVSVFIGTKDQSVTQHGQGTSAAASTVGSLAGNVAITAGKAYRQTGSDVLTPQGDVAISARSVTLDEARETASQGSEQRFRQSGVTVALTSPVISAVQGVEQQATTASHTRSSRMQALAAANAAMQVRDGARQVRDALAKGAATGGMGISVSVGTSSSRSSEQSSADSARGSSVRAGRNVNIRATGAGQDSNITVQGSDVKGAGVTTLHADNHVNLLAARNTREESNSQSSRSASVGVGVGVGAKGAGPSVTVSGSSGKGAGAGSGTTYGNTHVEGGQQVVIESGGDTTVQGATVTGGQVTARVAGNLRIESLQDSDQYHESSRSTGASATVGTTGGGGNVNLGRTRIDSDFTSVGEPSALRAGDGGFDVQVQGRTSLVGGQITSTDKAVQDGVNRYDSAGGTTASDLHNTAHYRAQSVSVGVAGGMQAPDAPLSAGLSGAGVGSDRGDARSTTTSGISGVASAGGNVVGNAAARTGDASASLHPIFKRDEVRAEVTAQVAITQEFGKRASQAVGDYAAARLEEARRNGDSAGVEAWREGGAARVGLHAVVGGLTGGMAGATGAVASQVVIDQLGQAIQGSQLPPALKQALVLAAGTAVGVAAGGTAGGVTAFNATANNYLSATDLRSRDQRLAAARKSGNVQEELAILREYDQKSARNTGTVEYSSVLTEGSLRVEKAQLEQVLMDPAASAEVKALASRSINELNTVINAIQKTPLLRSAAEVGLVAADLLALGQMAAARTLTSSIVQGVVARRTGETISADVAASIANNFYRDGALVDLGASRVLTNPGEAVFWSGRTSGVGGIDTAKGVANQAGGKTLEQLIEARQIKMPSYDPNIPSAVAEWQSVSSEFARNASGEVRVVLGSQIRPQSIWETVELPALIKNPAVQRVIAIDPKTGAERVLFLRGPK